MATFTFSNGQYIGSVIETYAGNPAFVWLKDFTFSGSATARFNDCFSRDYDSYHVVGTMGSSTNNYMRIAFTRNETSLGSVHQHALTAVIYATGITSVGGTGAVGSSLWNVGGTTSGLLSMTIHNPYLTTTYTNYEWQAENGGTGYTFGAGRALSLQRVNGFQLTNAGGGTVNGSLSLYGIRKS